MRAYRAQSYLRIESAASTVRRRLFPDLAPDEAVPREDLLERLFDLKIRSSHGAIRLAYSVQDLADGDEACAVFDANEKMIEIIISTATYVAFIDGDRRAAFTIAHEIGHAILHVEELISMRKIPHFALKRARGHDTCFCTEWQADAFAGAFLMPARGMALVELAESREPTTMWFTDMPMPLVTVLADRFGVSFSAAETRLSKYEAKLQRFRLTNDGGRRGVPHRKL